MSTQTVTLDSQISLRLCSLATGNFLVFIFHRFSISCRAAIAIHLFIGRHTQNAPAPRRGVPWHTFRYSSCGCMCVKYFSSSCRRTLRSKTSRSYVCVRHEFQHTSHATTKTKHEENCDAEEQGDMYQQQQLNEKASIKNFVMKVYTSVFLLIPCTQNGTHTHLSNLFHRGNGRPEIGNQPKSQIENVNPTCCEMQYLRKFVRNNKTRSGSCAWKRKNLLTIIPSPCICLLISPLSCFHRRSHTIRFNLTMKIEIKWN